MGPLESTYGIGASTDTPLGEYLKRPVQIDRTSWVVGSNMDVNLRPWELFLNNPQVKARLEGYKHVRGHLRIRQVVTGNPFLFGRVLTAYEPFETRSVFEYGSSTSRSARMCMSQLPHIYLDACTSEGGELTLPFFSPYNWIDLTRVGALTEMGLLRMINLTSLQHANSSEGVFDIITYAWMEDAEICTPTSTPYGTIVYQNGLDTNDEHRQGLISKPATAVAKGAGLLSRVPILRPYALATEVAANMVANVASIFGFSRPSIVDNLRPYREFRAGELATTNTHELIPKLAMDGKQGLTVDPRTVGLPPDDEMVISTIVKRESYLDRMLWSSGDVPGNLLGSFAVSPFFFNLSTGVTPARNTVPPCTAVAELFDYWRGTIVFRFSVVASAHHRGKLLIQYDPSGSDVGSTHELYSRIIDISETRDFEMPVEWHQSTPWLRRHELAYGTTGDKGYKLDSAHPINPNTTNGKLRVSVLTTLTEPDPSLIQDIAINIYVRGGDDLEFCVPKTPISAFSYRSSNVTVEPQNALADAAPADPLGGESIDAIGDISTPVDDKSSLVFFGEAIKSLRTILRRYQYHSTATAVPPRLTPSTKLGVRTFIEADRITSREFIMNWFAGWRGSSRFRCVPRNADELYALSASHDDIVYDMTTSAATFANVGAVEAELPFYSNQRFALCRTAPSWASDTDINAYSPNRSGVTLYTTKTTDREGNSVFYATGEDFSLFFFLNIPPFFKTV